MAPMSTPHKSGPQQRNMPSTARRALLLAAALTIALVWTAELSELDSAAMYAGRRGGRLQTMGSFIVRSVANRYGLLVLCDALGNGRSSSLNIECVLTS